MALLTPVEEQFLSVNQRQQVAQFIRDSDPETFRNVGDLEQLERRVERVILTVIRANPHWERVENSPYAALRKESDSLVETYKQLEKTDAPFDERLKVYTQLSSVEKKIRDYKCDLVNHSPKRAVAAVQWDCDKISEIKKRLGSAVQIQKEYYEKTWMGWIVKSFLRIIGRWHDGLPLEVRWALRILYSWDFKKPMFYYGNEYAVLLTFHNRIYGSNDELGFKTPWLTASWIQQHLKTDHLYNQPLVPDAYPLRTSLQI